MAYTGWYVRASVLCVAVGLLARASAADEAEDLAKKSQNPVANMISVPFEENLFFDVGPTGKLANVLNVKPVVPVSLGRVNLINRFILPVMWLEAQDRVAKGRGGGDLGFGEVFPGTSSEFGLGNLTYQSFFSPADPGSVIWGVGPALILPTNTDEALGADTWSAGISALLLSMPGKWVVGVLAQNTWSFATHGDAADQSSLLFQPIINYNLDAGWYLSSVPVITANWEADGGDTWTVPVGGGIGRLMRFGNQPIDLKLASYYNVQRPEFGPRWSVQFTIKLLFPK
jgi:hypothetical protein